MRDNHIAAALRAAGYEVARMECLSRHVEQIMTNGTCDQGKPCLCAQQAAAAVAAFLRALPANTGLMLPISPAHMRGVSTQALHALAAAVEQEARRDE